MFISAFELDISFEESIETAETFTKSAPGSLKAAIDTRLSQDQQANPYITGESPFKLFLSGSLEQPVSKIIFIQGYREEGSLHRLYARVVEKTFVRSKDSDDVWNSYPDDDIGKTFSEIR